MKPKYRLILIAALVALFASTGAQLAGLSDAVGFTLGWIVLVGVVAGPRTVRRLQPRLTAHTRMVWVQADGIVTMLRTLL